MSFDRNTGELWAADVGQNLWEEINIVTKGGNYGWSAREGKHSFDLTGHGEPASEKYIEPLYEYHHEVGKSITGGNVYRGEKVPALQGKYLYADYVGGQVWALDYNRDTEKVEHNYLIEDQDKPIVTFGEDEAGELYFTSVFGLIYRFVPKN